MLALSPPIALDRTSRRRFSPKEKEKEKAEARRQASLPTRWDGPLH